MKTPPECTVFFNLPYRAEKGNGQTKKHLHANLRTQAEQIAQSLPGKSNSLSN
jgi:hypothetical protein